MFGYTERDFEIDALEISEQNDKIIAQWLKDKLGKRQELFPEKYRRITGKMPPREEVNHGDYTG
jgi:hypothetical protein